MRVVVVGGGIAGLAAAHRLVELEATRGQGLDLLLVEARPRLGGTVATIRENGYLLELGPDSFLAHRPWALELCGRLGLREQLVAPAEEARQVFIVHRGRLHPLPEGFTLLTPSRLLPLLRSPLFSWRGKARMALDLVLPRSRAGSDESVACFVRRRLGREVLDRVAQPLVAGLYTADPETLSLAATMPRFQEMERRFRSLILATRRSANGAGATSPRSPFVALREGMEALVQALASRLPAGAVRCGTAVAAVERLPVREDGASAPRYRIVLEDGSVVAAHSVVVATPAPRAAQVLRGLDPELARLLEGIPYASSAVVTLGYRRDAVAHPLDGAGFLVPRTEGRRILACTFSSVKFPGRAPEGHVLLRVFCGGALDPGALGQSDATLTTWAVEELRALLGISAPPLLVRVDRHHQAMPQYVLGHLQRVAAIDARVAAHPGLALAGSAYRGVGIPECVRSGEEAALRALGLHE